MRYRASIVLAILLAASLAFRASQQSAPPGTVPGANPAMKPGTAPTATPGAPTKPADPSNGDKPAQPPTKEPPAAGDKPAPQDPTQKPAPALTPRQRAKHIKAIKGSIETESGVIEFQLEPNKCPLLTANFCNLVRRGFYDGRKWRDFSRVIRQVGTDTVWYTLPREFDPSLFFDKGGQIAASKDIEDTAKAKADGTRFFITVKNQERWNLDYPIFGHVTSGLNLLIDMKRFPPDPDRFEVIKKITVTGDVDALLETFAPEVAEWNKAIEFAQQHGAH